LNHHPKKQKLTPNSILGVSFVLQTHPLHVQELQRLVNQHGRPDDALEEAQHADPERGGVADVVDSCADESQPVDGLTAAVVNGAGFVAFFLRGGFVGHCILLLNIRRHEHIRSHTGTGFRGIRRAKDGLK
jgi:hypothetical protein